MPLSSKRFIHFTPSIGYINSATNIGVISLKNTSSSTNELYLIDAGNTADTADDALALFDECYGDYSVKAVILTHSHADHCGAAVRLKEKTGCEIWATEEEAALLKIPEMEASLIWGSSPIKDLKNSYYIAPRMEADRFISFEETVSLRAGDTSVELSFFPLKGHYIAMCGVRARENSGKTSIFLADGISGRNVIKKYWIQYLFDEEAFKESLEFISRLEGNWFVPGHGEHVCDAESLAELNIIAVLETEDLILDILKKGPLSTEDILRQVAIRSGLSMRVNQFVLIGSTLRSYLASLYQQERISFEITDNRLLWYIQNENSSVK